MDDTARSALIGKEVTLFLIQLQFDQELQRALNYDNMDAANSIRQRREALDAAIDDFQASKGPGDGARNATEREVTDFASEGLRLRSELQRAVEEERYKDASLLKGRLTALQRETDAASASAAAERGTGQLQFRLGQRVLHAEHGYRGIICGWDVKCCEDERWQQENEVDSLQNGASQPFYHVLVDARDWEGSPENSIGYLAEELLIPPESTETWGRQHGPDATFFHPYGGLLFLGSDHQGDLLPSRQLRQKYSAQRRDVGPSDDSDGGSDVSNGGGGPDTDDGPSGSFDFDGPGGGFNIM